MTLIKNLGRHSWSTLMRLKTVSSPQQLVTRASEQAPKIGHTPPKRDPALEKTDCNSGCGDESKLMRSTTPNKGIGTTTIKHSPHLEHPKGESVQETRF
jgi:hypothetical protein